MFFFVFHRQTKGKMPSSQFNTLMMLSSQLLSQGRFNEGLPSFITRGLDSEQIWQQLELRNDHRLSLPACTRDVVRIQSKRSNLKRKRKTQQSKKVNTEDEKAEDSGHSSISDDDEDENVLDAIKKRLADQPSGQSNLDQFSDNGDSENDIDFDFEMDKELSKRLSDEDEEDGPIQSSSKVKEKSSAKKPAKRKTVVDDTFFKLADMEQFLDSEDRKEEKRQKQEERKENIEDESGDESEEEDEEIDMFNETDEEDDVSFFSCSQFLFPSRNY